MSSYYNKIDRILAKVKIDHLTEDEKEIFWSDVKDVKEMNNVTNF